MRLVMYAPQTETGAKLVFVSLRIVITVYVLNFKKTSVVEHTTEENTFVGVPQRK